ncbi:flagellar hook protein FlgE [Roseomonas stagni]|uniref:Flagellar hook protein FlgE n=1 Tax=Falsiroseomonas algicola TaxID=2716930 RepID=A0A6M1LN26_9PROT|nr:flagellar hook protein FlgE [Falsiroseomonas algicola]NGM21765.1 flagellar hook protein FlgE [Falsiroseomonas algicola]
MSLFNSLATAVSGMTAQGRAIANISDNVANSQTTGYKRLDTSFEDMVINAGTSRYTGGVVANTVATNDVQGTISQVDNPLALALSGRGFFSVARPIAGGTEGMAFDSRAMFTRAGDFSLNSQGYMQNGSGDVLQGWRVDPATGTPDMTSLSPIRIDRASLPPEPTEAVTLSANLPASAEAGATGSTRAQVYDQLGNLHPVDLGWTRGEAENSWTLAVTRPAAGSGAATELGTFTVTFGTNGAPAGTIGAVLDADGNTVGRYDPANPANALLNVTGSFGGADQTIGIDLGRFGSTAGVTQYGGSAYELRSVQRDGGPAGAFASVTTQADGKVVVNYDNGESRTVAQVPVVTFADPDALERLDGQAFALTQEAGRQQVSAIGANGTGTLQAGAIEGSNVDIAAEFSKLIVAQRSYSANAKLVTTADELLQETVNLKR